MGICRGLFQIFLFWSVATAGLAHADPGDCSGHGPLVVGSAGGWAPVTAPAYLGEWRLPISSDDPDMLTEARVRVDLLKPASGKGALVSLNFSFPDPNPLGLPFTFERAEFSWVSGGQRQAVSIDWSQNCSGPGRSMYPHQSWTALVEVPTTAPNPRFEHPVIRVWGSRN